MKIPIFPLNGAILFPKTNLPLNIFEERYIEMVDYSLSNNRVIGMVQQKESNGLYNVGCYGKITVFNEMLLPAVVGSSRSFKAPCTVIVDSNV